MSQQLDDDVDVIVCFEIIDPYEARKITFVCEGISRFTVFVEFPNLLFCESRVDDVFDIVESSRFDFVVFRQDVHF